MEEIEISGVWWLPEDEDREVAGTLRFTPTEGIELDLIGQLKQGTPVGREEEYRIVLGAADSKLVTLYACWKTGETSHFPGVPREKFMPTFALLGVNFASPGELKFHRALVQYSYLPEWAGVSGFRHRLYRGSKKGRKFAVEYDFPNEVTARTPHAEISVTYSFHSGVHLREVNLRQSVLIRVNSRDALSLEEWLQMYVRPIQNFLSLATAKPNAVTQLSVYSRGHQEEMQDGKAVDLPIEVLYQPMFWEAPSKTRISPLEMLFTLSDVTGDFERVIQRWLEVAGELDSVCNLYFGVAYRPSMYLEQRFLSFVQAAESYHRRCCSNQVLPPEQHSARKRSILEAAPEEHRGWLKEKLGPYSNEPGLRRRLTELLDLTDAVMKPLAGRKKEFVERIVNTRNYHIHYDESLRKKAVSGQELYNLSVALGYLLQACFLRELHIEPARARELLDRNQRYLAAIRRARRFT